MLRNSITGWARRGSLRNLGLSLQDLDADEIALLQERLRREHAEGEKEADASAAAEEEDGWLILELDAGRHAVADTASPVVWHVAFVLAVAARAHSANFLQAAGHFHDIALASMCMVVSEICMYATALAVCIFHLPTCARTLPLLATRLLSLTTAAATALIPAIAATQSAGSWVWISGLTVAAVLRTAVVVYSESLPHIANVDPVFLNAALVTSAEVAFVFFLGVACADKMLQDADWSEDSEFDRSFQCEFELQLHFERLLSRRSKQRERQRKAAGDWMMCRGCGQDHWAGKGFHIDHQNHPNSPIRGMPSPLRSPAPGSLHSHFPADTIGVPPKMAPSRQVRVYCKQEAAMPDYLEDDTLGGEEGAEISAAQLRGENVERDIAAGASDGMPSDCANRAYGAVGLLGRE